MNEMLSKFINEALSCLVLVPATALCLFPMKDRIKYPLKQVMPLFLGILVSVTALVSCAAALLPIDRKTVCYLLLIPLFFTYRVIIDTDIFKCFASFLLSFTIIRIMP